MLPIKLLITIFVLFAESRAVLRFHEKRISFGGFLFWTFLWTLTLLFVFEPKLADRTAFFFGVGRGTDIMLFFGVILSLYLLYRLYVKLDAIEHSITTLNQRVSEEIHTLKKRK